MNAQAQKKKKESSKSDASIHEETKKDQDDPSVNSLTALMKCEKQLTLEDLWAVIDDSMKKRQKKVSIASRPKSKLCKVCMGRQSTTCNQQSEIKSKRKTAESSKFTLFPVFNSFGEELDNALQSRKLKVPCSPLGNQKHFDFETAFLPQKTTNSEINEHSQENSFVPSLFNVNQNKLNFIAPRISPIEMSPHQNNSPKFDK